MDEEKRGCDSCGSKRKNSKHMCLDCDYKMCTECYEERLVRNPGHRLDQRNERQLKAALSPTVVSDMTNDTIERKHASGRQRDSLCCGTCFNYTPDFIQPDWNKADGGMWSPRQDKPISELKTSADGGCDLCSIVYRAVAIAIPDALTTDTAIHLCIYIRMLTVSIRETRRRFPHYIKIHAMQGHYARWSTLETAEALSSSLRDARNFEKMKTWLNVCETSHSHPKCKQLPEAKLPRRLVAIRMDGDHPAIKLEEFHGEIGKYIALSHCWGGFTGCQTTHANYSTSINGIEYEDLPQTFKNAIYCALELHIAYVWIDSLCIVQDDPEDWERESSLMCDIYSNAWLVLAAASADADTKGFFTDPHELYRGISLESCPGTGDFDLVIHHDMPHPGFTGTSFGGRSSSGPEPLSPVSAGPLGKRAWTLQETLLARRCIGFNQNEVVWECQSANDCQRKEPKRRDEEGKQMLMAQSGYMAE
jgi:hypothetical protein